MSMKSINTNFFVNLVVTALSITSTIAQSTDLGPMVTDRPDATESPILVDKGYIQVETGAFYETFEDQGITQDNYTFNTTLIRIGLLENLELRLGADFVEGKTKINGVKQDDVSSGFSPLLFGAKVGIAKEKGWAPEIALMGHVYLPFTAGTDYKPQTTGVDFRFSLGHTLSERSVLGYNLGAAWGDDSSEAAFVYTLVYGYAVTKDFGLYAELYGDTPENSKANHFWDAGMVYVVSNNFQLDATIGTSITKGQDLLLSFGFSFRLPTSKQNI